jgi:hypothetical protein
VKRGMTSRDYVHLNVIGMHGKVAPDVFNF